MRSGRIGDLEIGAVVSCVRDRECYVGAYAGAIGGNPDAGYLVVKHRHEKLNSPVIITYDSVLPEGSLDIDLNNKGAEERPVVHGLFIEHKSIEKYDDNFGQLNDAFDIARKKKRARR